MTESTVKTKGGFGKIFGFFADSWAELKKVRWPNRKEMISYTLVVIVTVVFVAVYFAVVDLGISSILRLVFE
jgi:preprotein translocase subunit SecE